MTDFTSTNIGIVLNSAAQNPATVVTGAYVTNIDTTQHLGDAVYGSVYAWDFTNYGTIEATGTASSGVDFRAGGIVTNTVGGLISGSFNGVYISGTAGTVSNLGTIEGTGASGAGVYLAVSGSAAIDNAFGGLISGAFDGIALQGTAGTVSNLGVIQGGSEAAILLISTTATVSNSGTIEQTGTSGSGILLGAGDAHIANASGGLIEAADFGIFLSANGSAAVDNAAGALISGGYDGIALQGTAGTISNFGVIQGTDDAGIYLSSAAALVNNYGTIAQTATSGTGAFLTGSGILLKAGAASISNASGALVSGANFGVGLAGTSAGVTNFGTIQGTGTNGDGIYLAAGGSVAITNASSGLIAGGYDGISVHGTAAATTVGNLGTIQGTSKNGVFLAAAGSVVVGNESSGLIAGGFNGIVVAAGTDIVSNYGTIEGTGTNSDGIYLAAGGSAYVSNASSALISGVYNGVEVRGGAGTVSNSGTIQGTGTVGDGIFLTAGGSAYVNNGSGGLIAGVFNGVEVRGGAGTVSNSGTIQGTGTVGDGIFLTAGGSAYVNNAAGGLIAGVFNGVEVRGGAGTVSNFGTIQGTGIVGDGIVLTAGGSAYVNNAAGGLISGVFDGVLVAAGTGTVNNHGTIRGTDDAGIVLYATSGTSTVVNGATDATSALIAGSLYGVLIGSAFGTVINYGDIVATAATGTGIYLSFGTVTNFGSVTAGTGGTGIYLFGGNVTNSGTITAPGATAVIIRYGTFFNTGLVEGAVSGIELALGAGTAGTGEVTISGTVVGQTGISVAATSTASQTVTVAGSVIGTSGTAVSLTTGGSDRLVVAPGAVFQGIVDGGGGASVLEVAAVAPQPGAASGLAGRVAAAGAAAYVSLGSVVNFSALQVDPSATFSGSGALSFATLINEGQINVGSGNTLALGSASAAGTGIIDLQAGGTIDFQGAVTSQRLIFQPPGGLAEIDRPDLFFGTISGFTTSLNIIDLSGLAYAGNTSVGFNPATDVLTVIEGASSATLQLDTSEIYTGVTWVASADGSGGTKVAPVCFCRGTLILTERGEIPVEALAVGDRVVTLSGAAKPITWIGFGRDLVTRKNPLARPIVVRRGAFADNVPRRDLYLTHGHALYLDGVLIPVEHLVNHRSIGWDDEARIVEYYHIELEDHDVVFAEGAPAETYYDAGNRALFHNTRPGSEAGAARPTFAPVLNGGETVERLWARLFERSGGQIEPATTDATTDDPDLHLVIDSMRLDPASRDAGLYTFHFAHPPAATLRLCSRSAVPSLLGLNRHEHRRLGVAIRQIILSTPGVMTALAYDAPLFTEGGCHPPESNHIWTDGDLALPKALFAHLNGAFTLLIHTSNQTMRYSIAATRRAA